MEVGPLGGIGRPMQVTASGAFDAASQTLTLDETYRFDDGQVNRLQWRIHRLRDGRYEANEEASQAEPGRGEAAGAAFQLIYRREDPQSDGGSSTLGFDDWFVRIDPETVMVRAAITKPAVPVGPSSTAERQWPAGRSRLWRPEIDGPTAPARL